MRNRLFLQFFLILFSLPGLSLEDFEDTLSPFVLETKQIYIEGFEKGFNPSIVRFDGKLLMSFRNVKNQKDSYNSLEILLVEVDDDFNQLGVAEALKLTENRFQRTDDARLIALDGRLYLVYSDNEDPLISRGGFRVYVAEIVKTLKGYEVISKEKLTKFEGETPLLREKNWTPFEYRGNLLLSYSLNPHLVFKPLFGCGECETVAKSEKKLNWKWGELRGGTQGLKIEGEDGKYYYLTFFHSSIKCTSLHSNGVLMPHYFMGAALFDVEPPFEMERISQAPIIGEKFFSGAVYKPLWGSWRGVFPGGFFIHENNIWVVYGKQNNEIWVAKIDKLSLLSSLQPVFD